MGDLDWLPTSAIGQGGSDDSLGSFTVNPRNHRLAAGGLTTLTRIPAGMPQRTNRVFRQLVDREISPAKFEWRIATDNNRNDRQVRLVVGRFGECASAPGRSLVRVATSVTTSASASPRSQERERPVRSSPVVHRHPDPRDWRRPRGVGQVCNCCCRARRQLDNLESGRLGRVSSKDVQASGIADDGDSIPSRQGLFG